MRAALSISLALILFFTDWVVEVGDEIEKENHILNAETDKAVQEIYANKSGVIAKILVGEGEEVNIQDPIAVLVEPGEELDEDFTV